MKQWDAETRETQGGNKGALKQRDTHFVLLGGAGPSAALLNQQLMKKSRRQADIGFLVSPLTGSGVHLSRFEQLFLLAIAEGANDPAQWAAIAWAVLSQQDQRIIKDGLTLESADQNLAELTAQAVAFKDTKLPILRALGV